MPFGFKAMRNSADITIEVKEHKVIIEYDLVPIPFSQMESSIIQGLMYR
jgi:hypothetical protein